MPCTTALRAGRRARLGRALPLCLWLTCYYLLTTIYFAGAGRPRCAVSAVAGLVWPRSGQRQPRLYWSWRGRARRAQRPTPSESRAASARRARSGRERRARARRGAGRGPRARRGHSGRRRLCLCGHSASGSRAKNHTNQYNPPITNDANRILLRKLGRQRRDRRAQLLPLSGGHAWHASSTLRLVRPLPLQQ